MVAQHRRRLVIAAVLLAAGFALLVAAVVTSRDGTGETGAGPPLASLPSARAWFERDVHPFGEPVTAHIELAVAKDRILPDTVQISADFRPYELVGRPRRVTRDLGRSLLVHYALTLRCRRLDCVPETQSKEFEFTTFSARWRYPPPPNTPARFRTEQYTTQRFGGPLPSLKVTTRLADDDVADGRWRTGVEQLAAVTYRFAPTPLLVVLVLLALAMVGVAGGAMTVYVRRLRREAAERGAVAADVPLTPLEEALGLVTAARGNGDGRARMALDALAGELDGAGQAELAREAERIAWSPSHPDEDAVAALAAKVRLALESGR